MQALKALDIADLPKVTNFALSLDLQYGGRRGFARLTRNSSIVQQVTRLHLCRRIWGRLQQEKTR